MLIVHPEDSAGHLCRRCGFKGPHRTWAECITALRDQIADLELANTRLLEPSLKLRKPGRPPKMREAVVSAVG
jgi:hypothetical protein